ncbi:DddA-like double-stranded DNA deaminase toxin [Kribbella sp. NBC_01505]|uniref:DddA-like double-stranded DNA deaminase toxin n=1 Tax=Kribbella sp. NBC_01505 TaxID=2903580 RepID=UPI003866E5CC
MAPPKARGWAERLTGAPPGETGRPDIGLGERNPLISNGPGPSKRDLDGRGGNRRPDPAGDKGRPRGPGASDGGGQPPAFAVEVPDRPAPAPFINEIFRRLPDRPNNSGPTRGILTRTDGRGPIHLVSGSKGPGGQSPGLTGWLARLGVARDHVEGHAAALMRRAGAPREATLYLNNKPCGLDDEDQPLGCDGTLKYQLPPGSKLTVYWPGGHKIYIGEEDEPE